MPEIQHYESSMPSIDALETTCQGDEAGFMQPLKSLRAVLNDAGVKVTEAVYDGAPTADLGNVKVRSGSGHSAWILTVNTPVSISK